MPSDLALRGDFIAPGETYAKVGRDVASIAFDHPLGLRWWIALAASLGLTGLLMLSLAALFIEGVGIWGNNIPVTWALDIVSYDWWIGISSGGLLVSGTLLLLGMEWRSAVNRMAETVALVAAFAAGIYPIIHLGRPWLFYWNLPYPNTLLLYPQYKSPLVWDAFDILGFIVICVSFWYVGMLPDLATLRDRALERTRSTGRGVLRAQIYGIAALGWRGSVVHWERWRQTYRTLALLGILLVITLQTGASVMFAGTVEPGWHDTLLPVSYLLAAIFEGVGVVAAVVVMLRSVLGLQALITSRHVSVLAKLLLALGMANLYCYGAELYGTTVHGDAYEHAVSVRRFFGPHAWAAWSIVVCALVPVQLFWLPSMRNSPAALAVVGLLVAIGMFGDHVMIIVVTLQHDFLPSMAHSYAINLWELATFFGTVGLFLTLLLLAVRTLPVVSILELRRGN
jgi:Ni/Fe-hydrogenase subunit HybB-like protein